MTRYTLSDHYPFQVLESEGSGYGQREYAQQEADKVNRRVETWHSTCKPGRCTFKDANCPNKEAQS